MGLASVFDASFEQVRVALAVCTFVVMMTTFFLLPCYSLTAETTVSYTVLDDWNKGLVSLETLPPPLKPWLWAYLSFMSLALWIQFYNFWNMDYALGGTLMALISAGLAAVITDQLEMHVQENCNIDVAGEGGLQSAELGSLPYLIMAVPVMSILIDCYVPAKLFLT